MNKKLLLVALVSVFSAVSLNAMNKDVVNQYIRDESAKGHITIVGSSQEQMQVLPDGKKAFSGRIPYQSGWVNVRAQYNADGTPDESFGPQGLQAE